MWNKLADLSGDKCCILKGTFHVCRKSSFVILFRGHRQVPKSSRF
uniref:Uncharacterized protein n=1 Tax=Anguilla anguilla TaxID=7936 RepID=A0A0E9R816_ANGAN